MRHAHPEESSAVPAGETPAPMPLPRPLSGLERWLAPGILVAVALAQMVAATRGSLSPWKGGGFGMFSTVDGPGMRTLQAEGIDEQGRVLRLDVIGSLSGDLADKLQAKPNLHDLGPMGSGLLEQEWVAMDAEEQYLNQLERERRLENRENPDNAAARDNAPAPPSPADQTTEASPAALPTQGDEAPMYRVKAPSDLPGIPVTYLESVRLQWWRVRWDNDAARLYMEPLGAEIRIGRRGLWPDEQAEPGSKSG